MADQLSIRKGTSAELDAVKAVNGELGWDETNKRIRGFDGVKTGGYPTANSNDLPSSTNPVPVNAGGTGSTTASDARTALNAAKAGANNDINSLSNVAISGGSLDGAPVGQTTAAAGKFTNLQTTGTASFGGAVTITAGSIDGTPIGATTPSTVRATAITMPSTTTTAGTAGKIGLYGTTYGFGVSSGPGSLDYLSNGQHTFYSTTTIVGTFTSTGLNGTVIGASTPAAATVTVLTANTSVNLPSYTVATLPAAGTRGRHVHCSNARMVVAGGTGVTTEASGSGTGGLVTDNGTAWKIAGTNITVSA